MADQTHLVKFEHVQKSYDGVSLVVKDLNLDIAKGEFLTMLGPSGSGKTTTLMMLAGFEPATHGEIWLAGKPINNVPPHKRGIGMVFQNYALFPHMTVAENLAFPLTVRNLGKADIEAKVRRALDMVQLQGFDGRRPGQLSGGQQQRVAVARALVFEPELVLMDEPLGALDKQLREQMQFEIKHLHERLGVTVVYVTHDQTEALTMSDRVAVFDKGIIQQLSTAQELYEKPVTAFVAQFIGENNRFHGVIASSKGGQCEVALQGGEKIKAVNVLGGAVGSKTCLSIRPERVDINPAASAENVLPAVVKELVFLGDHMRVRLSVAGNSEFVVKVHKQPQGGLAQGQKIKIGWHAEDCRALDDN
ncbi:MAG: ABC transporter ATP-binding protein [Alphaproteobacteria bacterium]|nr:ABC transporter ATP-binding protein [Alphaproteobacteria bacterium]